MNLLYQQSLIFKSSQLTRARWNHEQAPRLSQLSPPQKVAGSISWAKVKQLDQTMIKVSIVEVPQVPCGRTYCWQPHDLTATLYLWLMMNFTLIQDNFYKNHLVINFVTKLRFKNSEKAVYFLKLWPKTYYISLEFTADNYSVTEPRRNNCLIYNRLMMVSRKQICRSSGHVYHFIFPWS